MTETAAVPALRRLDEAAARTLFGEPSELVQSKLLDRLDPHCRAFIERSPFLVVATYGAAGAADVSPRGDPSGSVRVLDERTLAIAERPGNKLIDTVTNIAQTGRIGLLFLVPGVNETLRVNGRAFVTDDEALLASLAVAGKVPQAAVVVEVEQAFLHCAKALIRSKLWDPDARIERAELPTLGEMIHDQLALEQSAAELDEYIEDLNKTTLY